MTAAQQAIIDQCAARRQPIEQARRDAVAQQSREKNRSLSTIAYIRRPEEIKRTYDQR